MSEPGVVPLSSTICSFESSTTTRCFVEPLRIGQRPVRLHTWSHEHLIAAADVAHVARHDTRESSDPIANSHAKLKHLISTHLVVSLRVEHQRNQ